MAYEQPHAQRLRATTRHYEEVVDVTIHAAEHQGVVFGLKHPGDYDVSALIERVEARVTRRELGVDVSD